MKKFYIFSIVFLFMGGLFSVSAQDLIIFTDGSTIEARITEISPSEIRYKRFDNLNGPTIVIPASGVLSIRYENGITEVVNAVPIPGQPSANTDNTAMNPDKLNFGIYANPAGFLTFGPSICVEFTKGKFNTEINLIIPTLGLSSTSSGGSGIGGLVTLNYFKHSRLGGFYIGGGIGFTYSESDVRVNDYYRVNGESYYEWMDYLNYTYTLFTVGLNIGYKFVTKSGLYFRTGAYAGIGFEEFEATYNGKQVDALYSSKTRGSESLFYFKPDLTIGYNF